MIACISLLIPPLMLSYMRKKILNKYESIYESIVNYIFCLLALNFLVMLILCYGFNSKDNLFFKLNQYNNFAIKYVLLSTLFAILEPNIEKVIREKISIDFNIKSIKIAETIQWKAILSIYATILFILNFIRIFDNNFWGDEAFTIGLIKNPIAKIVTGTASDVHPPLYYFIVRLAYVIFGNRGWVFHLVSLIPCFIILFLSLTVFWKQFGKEFSAILITLSCLSENAVVFNVEVRMYSWGSLFLLLSFYELYCILQIDNRRNYLLFALFSLAAAYTHYYCLIAVAFYYIVLLYLVFKRKYLNMRKVILCCTATVLGYLPWLVILVKSIKRVKDSYWINDIPTIKECVEYLFSNHFQPVVWGGYCDCRTNVYII